MPEEPQDKDAPKATVPSPERLLVMRTALDLAAEEDAARLRMWAWGALWLGVAFAYVVFIAWLPRGFAVADGFVLGFVAGAAILFILYEWRHARRSRDLIDLLLAPGKPAPATQG